MHWDGSVWTQIIVHGSSTWSPTVASGTSAQDVWVLGSEPTSSLALARCAENTCRTVIAPDSVPDAIGESVVALTPDDAWLVGTATASDGHATPFVERWDGTTWTVAAASAGVSGRAE